MGPLFTHYYYPRQVSMLLTCKYVLVVAPSINHGSQCSSSPSLRGGPEGALCCRRWWRNRATHLCCHAIASLGSLYPMMTLSIAMTDAERIVPPDGRGTGPGLPSSLSHRRGSDRRGRPGQQPSCLVPVDIRTDIHQGKPASWSGGYLCQSQVRGSRWSCWVHCRTLHYTVLPLTTPVVGSGITSLTHGSLSALRSPQFLPPPHFSLIAPKSHCSYS